MSIVGRLFEPLWALLRINRYASAAVFFAVALAGGMFGRAYLVLVCGLAGSAMLMLQAEADAPEPPHVRLPDGGAVTAAPAVEPEARAGGGPMPASGPGRPTGA